MEQEQTAQEKVAAKLPFAEIVAEELEKVERLLEEVVLPRASVISRICEEMLRGGKRLRPALVLLSAGVFRPLKGADDWMLVRAAAAVELLHVASLLHDDLVDQAGMRRGRQSAVAKWGPAAALLAGDYLAATAYRRLSLHARPRALRLLADAVASMCEAELWVIGIEPGEVTRRVYLASAAGKTGSLFAAACEIGALEGGADLAAAQLLSAYGRDLGVAFQVTDDLLDLFGDPQRTGKPVGQDIRAGQPNMAVVAALERDSDGRLAELLAAARDRRAEWAVGQAIRLVEELGGREEAERVAVEYAERAVDRLVELPANRYRDALAEAARFVVTRKK